jgi:hypothetical protein
LSIPLGLAELDGVLYDVLVEIGVEANTLKPNAGNFECACRILLRRLVSRLWRGVFSISYGLLDKSTDGLVLRSKSVIISSLR